MTQYPLQWTEKLSLGIPAIDAEHRRLLELAAALEEAFRTRRGKQEVEEILSTMIKEAEQHFQNEEQAFRLRGLEISGHAEIHAAILDRLTQALADFEQGEFGVLWLGKAAVIRRLLVQHLLEEDLKLPPE